MPLHFLNHDSCCIHCGMDTCDWPRGERVPPCPVYDQERRAADVRAWEKEREVEWEGVEDPPGY